LKSEYDIEKTAERLCGRFEVEIEYHARERTHDAVELAARVGVLLLRAGEWAIDSMPVRIQARRGRAASPQVENSLKSHGNRAQHTTAKRTGKRTGQRAVKGHSDEQARLTSERKKAAWTPKRRKRQAALMRQRNAERWARTKKAA
jgi:hypothetical protein